MSEVSVVVQEINIEMVVTLIVGCVEAELVIIVDERPQTKNRTLVVTLSPTDPFTTPVTVTATPQAIV